MFSAVTLSRSPPRADTTMIATLDCSRICRHSSNPSTSGSVRSSSTMSGCSVSSSASALLPSTDTSVSKPRTARLARIRSTMFGSSSTMSTRVGTVSSVTYLHSTGSRRLVLDDGRRLAGRRRGLAGRRRAGGRGDGLLYRQGNQEAGAPRGRLQLQAAAGRGPEAAGEGQSEPGPGPAPPWPDAARREDVVPARVPLPGRLGDRPGEFRGQSLAVVGHPHGHRARSLLGGGDRHLGTGRVMAERVAHQVDEPLLQPVVIGPDD